MDKLIIKTIGRVESLEDAICYHLSNDDCNNRLYGIEKQISNISHAMGRMMQLIYDKNLIDDDDVLSFLNELHSSKSSILGKGSMIDFYGK